MAEWQMDPSRFELQNLKLLVVYVLNYKHQQRNIFPARVEFFALLLESWEWLQVCLSFIWESVKASTSFLSTQVATEKREETTEIDGLYHQLELRASIVLRVSFWVTLFLISLVNCCHPNPRLGRNPSIVCFASIKSQKKNERCVIADISTFVGATNENRLNIFHVKGTSETFFDEWKLFYRLRSSSSH